ncbi:MAG: DUF29 family protein [Cyanobacteria bacterium P01_G01_bin.19]
MVAPFYLQDVIAPGIAPILQQILNCTNRGAMKQWYLEAELDYIYGKARKTAIDRSVLESDRFPEQKKYSLNDIIGEDS